MKFSAFWPPFLSKMTAEIDIGDIYERGMFTALRKLCLASLHLKICKTPQIEIDAPREIPHHDAVPPRQPASYPLKQSLATDKDN